jgi:uncharacterized protein with ParB-like and HNH nuclease domain
MENKVYYGEYSLQHWIDLILKRNIQLPPYQRRFVWYEEDVKKLIDAFKEKQFVPPIIIGSCEVSGAKQNLIIDGQQRLTSILLAFLGYFPNKKPDKSTTFANENDDDDENNELILEWTFTELIKEEKNKDDICNRIKKETNKYKSFNINGVDKSFFETNFLGFSYLVPKTTDAKEQQKYFSTVFRDINYQGKGLSREESRKSLYFLDDSLEKFFEPDFCKAITIKIFGTEQKLDFVRYLSLLSQYKQDTNADGIARTYKPKMEEYYEEYIYSVVNDTDSKTFGQFSKIFPDKKYDAQFNLLNSAISSLGIPKQYSSIIDADIYIFGLIYEIVFENKTIDVTKKDDLKNELSKKITEIKNVPSHTKSPAALKHLRNRIATSIEIYKKYVK